MIEECGRVVALEAGGAWVETLSRSGCGRCHEPGGCGQASITRLFGNRVHHILASCREPLQLGDQVVIAVPEHAVLRASMVVYLLPLLGLMLGTVAGHAFGSDLRTMLGALAGIGLGFMASRLVSQRMAREPRWQPSVIRRLSGTDAQPWSPVSEN